MITPLHILHLEDNPNDTALVQSALEAGGIACATNCVQTPDEFVAALERGGIDLILSDYSLPAFDGFSALKVAHARWPEIPLIFVSGTLCEERAIDSLNGGATDYVLKEHLLRLVPAVRRAMQEAAGQAKRRQLEAQFVEAQKMGVIGHLASGVAHDFNNILAVIIGYNDLMLPELAAGSLSRKCADEIGHAAERAVALTRQLLLFSRKETVQTTVLNLHEVIEGMDKMLLRLVGESVELSIVHGKEAGRIRADSGLIGQLLMNLVVNARDAMPNGGKLMIETANVTLNKNDVSMPTDAMPGDYVMLAVTDTGMGMTEEVKKHLFEAFFTTKPKGKGTGLGLATSQTIVQQCGGCIEVKSELGQGATFKIYFPRVDQPADISKKAVNPSPAPRGTETLLLVEDEPSVRHLASSILEAQGYTVLRANNGQDGLHVVRGHKGAPIRLVITDVIMPLMNGKVMAEWLKVTDPDLKILFTSGYTDDAIAQHGVLEAGVAFLSKPYSPVTLARKVRALLDNETDTAHLRKQSTKTDGQSKPMTTSKTSRLAIQAGVICLAAIGCLAAAAAGTNQLSKSSASLEELTLEQLVNVQVTSVSKKKTDLFSAPAAIYVITQEDIRRSGMTSIPELLRLVPGLDVARIDANHWAISSRGFNDQYANKLLVLMDGRSVYTPASAGVFWNSQDVPLNDIDRIEVIRGPGATLWGANAVNGVINIITKSAKDTQGGLVTVTAGTQDQPSTTVRYGGQLATNLFYRAYVTYFNRDNFTDYTGRDTADGWDSIRGGFRMDWDKSAENNFTLQGDYYSLNAGETIDETTLTPPFANRVNYADHDSGGNVLGRWTHNFSDTSQLSLQMYYDHSQQGEAPISIKNDTYDFDLQHRFALGSRQDIVWGAGYRYLTEDVANPDFFVTFTPGSDHEQLFTTFLQDDITVIEHRLHLIVGSKFEHNDITGFEVEPSVRLAWTPTEKQTIWAAVSRAVRTPAYSEQDIRNNRSFNPPVLITVSGNPNLASETLIAYELGYRIKPAKRLSFDVASYYNVYDQLIAPVQGAPFFVPPAGPVVVPLTFQNNTTAETYGTEISGEWSVTDNWKLTASYTFLQTHLNPSQTYDNNPQNQFQIRSYLNLPHHVELNGAVYYVDEVNPLLGNASAGMPAYVRVDLGVTWRPIKSLELGIYGQNLLDDNHSEFTSYKTTVLTEIPRSVMGRITWRF